MNWRLWNVYIGSFGKPFLCVYIQLRFRHACHETRDWQSAYYTCRVWLETDPPPETDLDRAPPPCTIFFMSWTDKPVKVSTCDHDRHVLQQLSLNVHIKHSDHDLDSKLIDIHLLTLDRNNYNSSCNSYNIKCLSCL